MSSFDIARRAAEARGFDPGPEVRTISETRTKVHEMLAADEPVTRISRALVAGDEEAAFAALRDASVKINSAHLENAVAATYADYPWPAAYDFIADLYDRTAAAFTEAVTAVDPDAPAESVATLTSKAAREGWAAVPGHAKELERLAADLSAVATVALPGFVAANPPHALGLRMRASSVPAVLEAWQGRRDAVNPTNPRTFGRGGRWHAAIVAGATLKAARVDDFTPPSPPEPEPEPKRGPRRAARV